MDRQNFTVLDGWRLFIKHRMMIGIVTAIALVLSALLAFILPPAYRAEVVLTQVTADGLDGNKSASPLSGLAGLAGISVGKVGQSAERLAILRSRALVEEFIDRRNLIPVLLPQNSNHRTSWFAVRRFRDRVMTLKEDPQSGVITLMIDWTNPAVAAEWANGFAALANDVVRRRDVGVAERNITFLNQQIPKTNDVELHRAIYNLIENETKTIMLANSRPDYAFAVVDPAVPPGTTAAPARLLIVLLGGMFGLSIGFLFVVVRSVVLADARRVESQS